MALVENIKVQAQDVEKGGDNVARILPTTNQETGALNTAVLKGGRVLIEGNLTQTTEQQPPAGTKLEVNGTITNPTHYFTFVPTGHRVSIRGGTYINTNKVTPQPIIRTPNDSGLERLDISDMDITGDVQEDLGAAYAIDLRGVTAATVRDVTARKFTGAVHLNNCSDVEVRNLRAHNMVFIPSQDAGGYGVLLGACRNVLIDGLYFRAVASEGAKGRHAFYVSAGASDTRKNSNIVIKNVFCTYSNLQHRYMYTGVLRTCSDVTIDNLHTYGGNAGIGLHPGNGPLVNVKLTNSVIQVIQIDDNTPCYGIGTSDFGESPVNSYVNFFVSNVVFDMVLPSGITNKRTCAIRFNGRDSQFRGIRIQESATPASASISPIVLGASYNLLFDGVTFSNRSNEPAIKFEANVEQLKLRNFSNAGRVFDTANLVQYGKDVSVDWSRKGQVTTTGTGSVTTVDANALFKSVSASGVNCVIRFNDHVTWDAIENVQLQSLSGLNAVVAGWDEANRSITVRLFNGLTAVNFDTTAASWYVQLFS